MHKNVENGICLPLMRMYMTSSESLMVTGDMLKLD